MTRAGPLLASALALAAAAAAQEEPDPEALLRAGRPGEARAVLEKRLEGAGTPAARALLHEALGRCRRAEGDPWEAEAAFGRALEGDPALAAAALGRGEVFLDLAASAASRPVASSADVRALASDAERWLGRARELAPEDPRPILGLGRARLFGLDFTGAGDVLRDLAARRPGDPAVRHLLAEALRGGGDPAAAAAAEAEALRLDPSLTEAAVRRVGDLVASGDPSAARAAAEAALLAAPASDPLYRALWGVDAPARRFAALGEVMERVAKAHPKHPKVLHYLGYARASAGRRDAALEAFRQAAEANPADAPVRVEIARLLARAQDHAGASASYEEALRTAPEGSPAWTESVAGLSALASAHGAERRYAEAERILRLLCAVDPRTADHPRDLGLTLKRQRRMEEAEKSYRAAVEVASPFDGGPRNDLGLLYLGWGRTGDAEREFREAADIDPRTTDPQENLGAIARARGEPGKAMESFREALRRCRAFGDRDGELKFRRYLDLSAREAEGR